MKKYIIKAYNDNGFYGYLAEHPEQKDAVFYDNEVGNAIRFDSLESAERKAQELNYNTEMFHGIRIAEK